MNHLESSFTGKNNLWRYFVMIASVLVASNTVGALPLFVAYISKSAANPEVVSRISENPNDLSVLGLDPNLGLLIMLFPFLAGLATFFILIKPLNDRTFTITINGTAGFRWSRFLISFLVWMILSALFLLVYLKSDPGNFKLSNTTITLIPLALISFLFIPFQAAFEEVVFRGYLMQGFAVLVRNRWFPLLITSVLFGLMHTFNPEVKRFGFLIMMPEYILFGLIFGIVTILDDGIEAATGAHTANNIFLCVMVTHESSALQTPALYVQNSVDPYVELAALLVCGIIFIGILKLVFRWRSFSVLFSRVEAGKRGDQSPYTDVLSSLR